MSDSNGIPFPPTNLGQLAALMRLMRVHGARYISDDKFSLDMAAQAAEPLPHEQPGTTTAEQEPERPDALDFVTSGRIPGDPSGDGTVPIDRSSS